MWWDGEEERSQVRIEKKRGVGWDGEERRGEGMEKKREVGWGVGWRGEGWGRRGEKNEKTVLLLVRLSFRGFGSFL